VQKLVFIAYSDSVLTSVIFLEVMLNSSYRSRSIYEAYSSKEWLLESSDKKKKRNPKLIPQLVRNYMISKDLKSS
jgi:CTP:phosphocholine cytidylyltransferase-like protein